MKAKFFLAAILMLALSIGSAFATPTSTEVNKTTMAQGTHNANAPMHHRHHRHHHHHMMHH